MEKSRPHVIISAAMTIDGKIASKTGDSKLSSKSDKRRVHQLRSTVDAILVGKNTVSRDNPVLSVRYYDGKNPIRIILDSHGTLSSSSKIIKTCKTIPTIVVVSKKISKKNLVRLKQFPIEIIISGKDKVNINKLLSILKKKKISRILVEGGGTVNWEFLKNGIFDEIIITITPFMIGGKESISLVEGDGFSKILQSPKLKLKKFHRLKNEMVLEYSKL
jgi:2,5-diamino-6-(ribosylamino)-4(3H)-pyrimidinone 5'-phosphate reductase